MTDTGSEVQDAYNEIAEIRDELDRLHIILFNQIDLTEAAEQEAQELRYLLQRVMKEPLACVSEDIRKQLSKSK